jgi:threonine/homoserine/homoserine lactone efflux protein
MLQDLLSGIPLGIFLSFMVGPVFFVLLETSAVKGFRAAFVFDLGVVTADIFFITIAYFSSYRLIQSIKNDPAIYVFGGILMLTYGIISFLKTNKAKKELIENEDDEELVKNNYLGLFIKGFLLNFINPL